jgi:hypothetical protein
MIWDGDGQEKGDCGRGAAKRREWNGRKHTCEIYAVLNLAGFLTRGLMLFPEGGYRKTRASLGRRETFLEALRFSFRRFPHENREEFLIFVSGYEPGRVNVKLLPLLIFFLTVRDISCILIFVCFRGSPV